MKRAIITVGLGFGDEGKGASVDFLCRKFEADGVVRYSGGSQCAHNVVLPDGRSHIFAMFGSGSLIGLPTYLGPQVIINPSNIINEAAHIGELVYGVHKDPAVQTNQALHKLVVHPDCLVTTFFTRELNRLKERNRNQKHGSCGQGIGETRSYWLKYGSDAITAKDLKDSGSLHRKLELQRQRILNEIATTSFREDSFELASLSIINEVDKLSEIGSRIMLCPVIPPHWKTVVFEGAQGVLLDEWHGFHPHTTWSTVTPQYALEMVRHVKDVKVYGITRTYTTRHGAGPLPTFDAELTERLPDPGNPTNEWQDSIRNGWLDMPLLRYAAKACGRLDGIMVTCVDQMPKGKICRTHGLDKVDPRDVLSLESSANIGKFIEKVNPEYQDVTSGQIIDAIKQVAPVVCTSHGRTHKDRKWTLK